MAAGGLRRAIASAGVLVCLAAGLAACGNAGASSTGGSEPRLVPPLMQVRESAAKTVAAKSAHLVITVSSTALGHPPQSTLMTIAGDVSFPGDRVAVTQSLSNGPPLPSTGQAPTELIGIGKTFYHGAQLAGDHYGEWVKQQGQRPFQYFSLVTNDGFSHLQGHVRIAGGPVIDGMDTNKFTVAMPGAHQTRKSQEGSSETVTLQPYTLDVWLTPYGRIVQLRATRIAATQIDGGAASTETSTTQVNFSRFGEPFHITAPADANTLPRAN